MRKLFCFIGLHSYRIKWIKHPEGMLGYWYCPICLNSFNGFIHKPNQNGGASAWIIRKVCQTEVKDFSVKTPI